MFGRTIWDKLPERIFQNLETKKHFALKLISFNNGQLQISEWAITKQRVVV